MRLRQSNSVVTERHDPCLFFHANYLRRQTAAFCFLFISFGYLKVLLEGFVIVVDKGIVQVGSIAIEFRMDDDHDKSSTPTFAVT